MSCKVHQAYRKRAKQGWSTVSMSLSHSPVLAFPAIPTHSFSGKACIKAFPFDFLARSSALQSLYLSLAMCLKSISFLQNVGGRMSCFFRKSDFFQNSLYFSLFPTLSESVSPSRDSVLSKCERGVWGEIRFFFSERGGWREIRLFFSERLSTFSIVKLLQSRFQGHHNMLTT